MLYYLFRAAEVVFLNIIDDTEHTSCADDLEMLSMAGAFFSALVSRTGGTKGNAKALSKLCTGLESIARNATQNNTSPVGGDETRRGCRQDKLPGQSVAQAPAQDQLSLTQEQRIKFSGVCSGTPRIVYKPSNEPRRFQRPTGNAAVAADPNPVDSSIAMFTSHSMAYSSLAAVNAPVDPSGQEQLAIPDLVLGLSFDGRQAETGYWIHGDSEMDSFAAAQDILPSISPDALDLHARLPIVAEFGCNHAGPNPSTECMAAIGPSSLVWTMALGDMDLVDNPGMTFERL
jgi:hypothetical protein